MMKIKSLKAKNFWEKYGPTALSELWAHIFGDLNSNDSKEKGRQEETNKEYYDDAQFFVDYHKIIGDAIRDAIKDPGQAMGVITAVRKSATAAIKYVVYHETKQEEIRANCKIEVEKIRLANEAILKYLDRTFDERKSQFEKFFSLVDTALSTGDSELLTFALNNINELASSSPFRDLAEVQTKLKDKGTVWDI